MLSQSSSRSSDSMGLVLSSSAILGKGVGCGKRVTDEQKVAPLSDVGVARKPQVPAVCRHSLKPAIFNLEDENGPWVYDTLLDTTDDEEMCIEPVDPTNVISKTALSPARDTNIVHFDAGARNEMSSSPSMPEDVTSKASIGIVEERTTVVGSKPTTRAMANIVNKMHR